MASSVLATCTLVGAVILCGWACGQAQLSDSDEQELLDAHNHFRGIVDPIATNMERMVWNTELSQVAQTYAEMCVFAHNGQRNDQVSSYAQVGENLAITTASPGNYTDLVESWYNEVQDYTYNNLTCTEGRACGHYTQVVWATSNNLGCGAFRCDQVEGLPSFTNALYLVCNYGPAGNLVGTSPYESGGESCSACPVDKSDCVGNLCSTPQDLITPSATEGTPSATDTLVQPTPSSSPGLRDEGGGGEALVPLSAGFLTALTLLSYLLL